MLGIDVRTPSQSEITFQGGDSGGFNPADATPFYLGRTFASPALADPTTTAPTGSSYAIPKAVVAGTIKEVHLLIIVSGVAGSTETGALAIRINNSADSAAIAGLQWNAVSQTYSATGLNIALAAGDFWVPKITPPTWATNPTVTFYMCTVIISYP